MPVAGFYMRATLAFNGLCDIQTPSPGGDCKKGVLKNFAKFIGKHLCRSLFFNEFTAVRPAILFKKIL